MFLISTSYHLDYKFDANRISLSGVAHLEELVTESLELPSVNQIELHPFCRQSPIVDWCKDHGVIVQAYCPIIRGQRWDHPVLEKVAKKHAKDIPQILIRWSLQMGSVGYPAHSICCIRIHLPGRYSPLPKSAHPERVRSNAELFDFELDSEDMEALNMLDEGDKGAVSWNPIHAP